jgi:YihY family inner membrane protein
MQVTIPSPFGQHRPLVTFNLEGPVVLRQLKSLGKYLTETEVHTFAFSVAANAILALFPFIILMMTLSTKVLHWPKLGEMVVQLMSFFLPTGQYSVINNMSNLVVAHKHTQIMTVVMLLISSTGVFLPLEVALNQVWGVSKNRNYLHNQVVSTGLALAVGVLAMCSVFLTAVQQTVFTWIFFGHTDNFFFKVLAHGFLAIVAVSASILLFFLIYWILPNRKIPYRAVVPAAILTGLAWEIGKHIYILVLPHLDYPAAYGPFSVSVGLMTWAFITGLIMLAGARFSASLYADSLSAERDVVVTQQAAVAEVAAESAK